MPAWNNEWWSVTISMEKTWKGTNISELYEKLEHILTKTLVWQCRDHFTQACMHACIHAWMHTHSCMHACPYTCMHACIHMDACMHVFIHACTHMYACMHAHIACMHNQAHLHCICTNSKCKVLILIIKYYKILFPGICTNIISITNIK